MDDEAIEDVEVRPSTEDDQEPDNWSNSIPDIEEMNLFVLDLFDEFKRDPGNALTDFEFNGDDEAADSSESSSLEKFIAMIKFSEKVPQMYREMGMDELRDLLQKGLQSRKFVPIIPNAQVETGKVSRRGALSTIPYPVKPKATRGPYKSSKESISQTGPSGHHGAYSRSIWETVSRNRKEAVFPFDERVLAISPQVEASLRFLYDRTDAENVNEVSSHHRDNQQIAK